MGDMGILLLGVGWLALVITFIAFLIWIMRGNRL
jgi:hypothetical protein